MYTPVAGKSAHLCLCSSGCFLSGDKAHKALYKAGAAVRQVQYPGCLPTMMLDLTHIRVFADYLRHTEIKFDLVSAVDELAGQVRMEFDFQREAMVMDTVAHHLQVSPWSLLQTHAHHHSTFIPMQHHTWPG